MINDGVEPEIMEVPPVSSNQQGTDGRVKNASPRKVEKQSLLTPEERESNERESNETHNSKVNPLWEQKNEVLGEKREAMLIVSVLIAALTYQAALNPPGGFWQDNSTSTAPRPNPGEDEHEAGTAINADYVALQRFTIANTVGLFASLTIILLLTSAVTIRRQIMMWVLMVIMWVSVFSVAFSFISGVAIILRDLSDPAINYLIAFGLGCMGLFAVLTILHALIGLMEIYGWLKKKISHSKNVCPVSHSSSNGTV